MSTCKSLQIIRNPPSPWQPIQASVPNRLSYILKVDVVRVRLHGYSGRRIELEPSGWLPVLYNRVAKALGQKASRQLGQPRLGLKGGLCGLSFNTESGECSPGIPH